MCGSCGCGSGCVGCKIIGCLVTLLVTLITVAALVGVYVTHMTPEGWVFGTMEGSLALFVLLASVTVWLKLVKKMCPCGKMGGACGGGGCCKGGMCPGCGKDPCVCR